MHKSIIAACFLTLTGTANATVIIDENQGWDGYFAWDSAPGQIDNISLTEYPYATGPDKDWSITVAEDSTMSMATAWDDYVPGDTFSLYLDGIQTSWTNTFVDSNSYFHGEYLDLFLSAGVHTLTLFVEPGSLSTGAGHVSFSSVAPVSVPEPSTLLLFGLGIAGLLSTRKKSSKDS